VIVEDKPTEDEHKSGDVDTPKPEERDEPQAQMQTLMAQMKEL
jgi:hypothetical protein